MNRDQARILAAAFCGFAFLLLALVAKGFHDMEAGYLPIITAVAATLPLYALVELFRD